MIQSNFQFMTFQVQVIVHSTRLDERNTMLVKESSCKVKSSKVKLSQNLLQKNGFRKDLLFWQFLPPGGETFDGRSNLRVLLTKSINRAIKCAFPGRCSFISVLTVRRLFKSVGI